MPDPSRLGGITSVHVSPAGGRVAVTASGRVLRAVKGGWATAHHVSPEVAREWPLEQGSTAWARQSQSRAAMFEAQQRTKDTPWRRRVREFRERQTN